MVKLLFFKHHNIYLPVIITFIFIVIFMPLHSIMGDGVIALSLFPVAVAGWLLGIRGGLIWSILLLVIDTLFLLLEGNIPFLDIFIWNGAAGFLSLIGIGIVSGWAGNLYKKVKTELLVHHNYEAALLKSEEKYRLQFENMVEGIAIDQLVYEKGQPIDWIVQDINPAYEKILNITRAKVIGQRASNIYGSQEIIKDLLQDYDLVVKTGNPISRKIHSLIGDREIVGNITSLGENRVAVIFNDITEQERALQAEKEHRKFSEAMQNIASILNSTFQLTEVLDIILENMGQFASYEVADIMLLEDGRLRIARQRGYSERGLDQFARDFNFPIDAIPTTRWMAENLRPIILPETASSDVWSVIPETAWICSYAGLPIISKGKLIGLLNFSSSKCGFFTDFPIDRIKTFADQAALAIQNARTFEETNKRAQRLALINRVASRLNQPAELEIIQQLAVDCMVEALNLEQAGLALLSQGKRHLVIVADHLASGNMSTIGIQIPLENNPSMDFIEENKTSFWSEDAQHDPRLAILQSNMIKLHIHSILIVPLLIRGEIIGTIGCDITIASRRFSQEEMELAETLANLAAGRIEQARLLDMEKKRAAELALLHDTTLAITQPYDLSKLLETIIERAAWLLDCPAGILYLKDHESQVLECKVSYNNIFDQAGTVLNIGEGAAGIVAQTGQPLIIPDYSIWNQRPAAFQEIQKPFALLSVPVVWQSQVKGVIQLIREQEKEPFEAKDADLLGLFSSQVAISLENGRLYQEVQQLAVLDSLSNIYNRRGFMEIGVREVERALRFVRHLSVLFLDLDHFKAVNDQYGHSAGDQVLSYMANLCGLKLRNVDVLGRYGGEEFVALLLETDMSSALCIAERLRIAIAEDPIETEFGTIHISVSIGVAEFNASMNGLEDLIHHADQAMYKAKASGRNCVWPARNN